MTIVNIFDNEDQTTLNDSFVVVNDGDINGDDGDLLGPYVLESMVRNETTQCGRNSKITTERIETFNLFFSLYCVSFENEAYSEVYYVTVFSNCNRMTLNDVQR